MRLSLAFEMQRPVLDDHAVIEDTLQQCILADEVGFDAVWFVEHHFLTSFSMSPCPEVMFGALSRLTKHIRLGLGVVILPYHHPVRVAELQPATYQLAAELGIGVMALSVASPSYLAPHIKAYKERVRNAAPVGQRVNDQWLSATMAFCDQDAKAARELAAKSLRTFFGPDRPYLKDQTHLYEQLVESWGGVPEHLKANFARYLKGEGVAAAPEVDLSGGSGQIASALWNQIDADTLVERGVLVAGDPDDCLRSIAIHEAAGVDELQFLMATETVPHDKVMSSIEMFGKYVIPELKRRSA